MRQCSLLDSLTIRSCCRQSVTPSELIDAVMQSTSYALLLIFHATHVIRYAKCNDRCRQLAMQKCSQLDKLLLFHALVVICTPVRRLLRLMQLISEMSSTQGINYVLSSNQKHVVSLFSLFLLCIQNYNSGE